MQEAGVTDHGSQRELGWRHVVLLGKVVAYTDIYFCVGILLHNLTQRSHLAQIQGAHKGKVSGLCFTSGDRLLSCGVDRNVKLWDVGSVDPDAGPSVRHIVYALRCLSYICEGPKTTQCVS